MRKICLIIFFLFIFLLFPVTQAGSGVLLTEVKVNYNGPEKFEKQLPLIVPFEEGQEVTKEEIEEHFLRLNETGTFKDVQYHLSEVDSQGYRLEIDVVKTKRVRNIIVKGNYPILSKHIKKLIPLQPGTDFDGELIPESIETVKAYLEKEGYYDSLVTISVRDSKEYEVKDLVVKIKRGHKYHVRHIEIEGNQFISKKSLRNKINRFSRFKMRRLKKNLKNIQKMYASYGYIKARVKLKDIIFHEDIRKVDVFLTVRENKKFKLIIKGKTYFNKQRLKAVTNLKEWRSYDRYAIKKSKLRLERYYRLRGFPDAIIEADLIKPDKHSIIAQYTIIPGKRVSLRNIKFVGNKKMGAKKLKKSMLSQETGFMSSQFFYENKLYHDATRLEDAYEKNGFFDVDVSEPEFEVNYFGDQKIAIYNIEEGHQYRLGQIRIESDLPVNESFLLKKSDLRTGKKFKAEQVERAKNQILDEIFEEGFAYASIAVSIETNKESFEVDVVFKITRGKQAFIRSIVVDGHLITNEKVIRNNLKIKSGEVFQYQKMLDGQLNLRKLGIFTSVRLTPLGFEEKEEQIDLLISVIERKSISMSLQGGYDSRHLVTGEFNLTKYNIYGTGRQLNSRFIGGPKYDRIEMTFFSPRVFGASWNLSVQVFGEYEDEVYYTAASYGGFASTLKNFGSRFTFGFKEQVSQTEVFESESDVATLGDSLFDNTFNEFQLSFLLDFRDNFSDPQKGFYILAQNELNTDLSNVKNNFNTFEFNMNHYLGFFKKFTLVSTFRYGHTFELSGDARIPVNKLFFLGGSETLRGFGEDAIDPSGGTIRAIYNTELQLRVTESVKVAGFFDAGIIADSLNALSLDGIRQSAGVGFRYFTPIGPIRLDWGFILDRQAGEPRQRVHFSFGYFF